MKIVAFLSNKLTLRGTEVAMYDYADYNEKILGNKSIIITRDYNKIKHEYDVDIQAYNKFSSRFPVYCYQSREDINNIVKELGIQYLYVCKGGNNEGLYSDYCKNIIHCIFVTNDFHGDIYVPLGQTINNLFNTNYPVLHYMVTLPDIKEDLRTELNIPKDAIVFGRHGGKETFDIQFVYSAIKKILDLRNDVYFLFLNTNEFYHHPRIIYLPGTSDMIFKRKFINTCDALMHARFGGETFGLVCGEFAICKKPVITYAHSRENEHLLLLKEKAVTYTDENSLLNILITFDKNKYNMDNNGYMECSPEKIMNVFNNLCLS